jgi:hypothetical protein
MNVALELFMTQRFEYVCGEYNWHCIVQYIPAAHVFAHPVGRPHTG